MSNDDFPAELERAYQRIEQLEQDANTQQRNIDALHREAWWRTYNAALTGLSTRSDMICEQINDAARFAADLAHGSSSRR